MIERLRTAVDVARVIPMGATAVALGTAIPAITAANTNLETTAGQFNAAVAFTYGMAAIGVGVKMAASQLRLKQWMEGVIEQHGFDERTLAVTTNAWCSRQTGRVVCENAGVLAQYEELCRQQQATAQFAWLPHC